MAEARQRHDWSVAASLMALVANAHRNPKKGRPLRPSDFDPFAKPTATRKVGIGVLKDVFIEGRMPQPHTFTEEPA